MSAQEPAFKPVAALARLCENRANGGQIEGGVVQVGLDERVLVRRKGRRVRRLGYFGDVDVARFGCEIRRDVVCVTAPASATMRFF